jgi:hypothetical protein
MNARVTMKKFAWLICTVATVVVIGWGAAVSATTQSGIITMEFDLSGHAVDPADVRKMMLIQNLTMEDAKTRKYREYYWGAWDQYRVKLGEGRDLYLNPSQHGEPVNYLMYPFAQLGTETLDWLDPATFKYNITYRQ